MTGTRVTTPLGPGVVNYVRMAAPTYSVPEAISVLLDSRHEDLLRGQYSGTIFNADSVFVVEPVS